MAYNNLLSSDGAASSDGGGYGVGNVPGTPEGTGCVEIYVRTEELRGHSSDNHCHIGNLNGNGSAICVEHSATGDGTPRCQTFEVRDDFELLRFISHPEVYALGLYNRINPQTILACEAVVTASSSEELDNFLGMLELANEQG